MADSSLMIVLSLTGIGVLLLSIKETLSGIREALKLIAAAQQAIAANAAAKPTSIGGDANG